MWFSLRKAATLRPEHCSTALTRVGLHRVLVRLAGGEDDLVPAGRHQAAFSLGQRVAQDNRDEVLVDVRPGLRGAAPCVLAEQAHDGIGDVGRDAADAHLIGGI